MKTAILFLLLEVASLLGWAQNLVPNPGFETYSTCPGSSGISQIGNATPWVSISGSPDFWHSCSGGVPNAMWGSAPAFSGNGYAGLLTQYSTGFREYMGVPLTSPLVPGVPYHVSFRCYLAPRSPLAASRLGVTFANSLTASTNNFNHIGATTPYTNNTSWSEVCGVFVPATSYTHLTMGNFHDNANTATTSVTCTSCLTFTLYYIDNVYVGITPAPGTSCAILAPVISDFQVGNLPENGVALSWSTSGGFGESSCEVQRSFNGRDFEIVSFHPVSGPVLEATDFPPFAADAVYYRIRLVDQNGQSAYSPVRSLRLATPVSGGDPSGFGTLEAYPSVVSAGLPLIAGFDTWEEKSYILEISDIQGHVLHHQTGVSSTGYNMVELLTDGWAPGMYLLTLRGPGFMRTLRISVVE